MIIMIKLLDYRKFSSSLRRPGKPITPEYMQTPEFRDNLEAMKLILARDGVGLAATQVNWPVQLFMLCIDESTDKIEPEIFINPEITNYSKSKVKMEEGCLSFPDLYLKVSRPSTITWSYTSLDNKRVTKESTGWYARAVQHEFDHCQGKVFVDAATSVQKLKFEKWLKSS
jgi:peptide deformylase